MARARLRRLVVDERTFLYRMDWHHDRDGERIVEVAIYCTDPERSDRPRGHWLRAHFVSREPEYPADSAVALPADVRAVLDRGRELGWNGTKDRWLLPACGLERPSLVLTAPTRLRAWAGDAALYVLVVPAALAEPLARELGAPVVAEARGGAEAQWRDDHTFVLRSRWGQLASVYLRTLDDLVGVLDLLSRRFPQAGTSLQVLPAQVLGPTAPAEATQPGTWATQPAARRHRGWREGDVIWTFVGPDGPQLEAYEFYPDAPDRLWRWLSVRGDVAVERRFRSAD